jgi:RHS repeat-associated protein
MPIKIIKISNGITRETMFNDAGRITSINHTGGKSNETMPAQFYAYNDAGQKILQLDETGRVTSWEYDNAGRLAEASYAFAGGKSVTDFWERIYLGVIPEDIANGSLNEADTLTSEIETLVNQNPILGELGFTNKDYMDNLDEAYLELSDVFPDLKKYDFTAAAKPKNDFAFKANWGHLHKFLPEEIKKYFNPGHLADLLEQPQWTESFSYDTKGNIANKTNGWGDISYSYNAENQLVKAGEREYSFDNNGNMTAEWTGDLTASYAYDKENRLTEVTTNHQGFIGTPGNLMDMGILYSYDSLGRRVSREEITDMQNGDYRDRFASSGERMSYLYDGLSFNMLAEGRDASGIDTNGGWHSTTSRDFKPTSEYLRTNGRVITRSDVTTEGHSLLDSYYGGYLEKGYYTEDSLGSVMAITNSKGSITDSYSYDSFGRLTEGSFDGINRLGYNGKRVDPVTGRSDYGFRDYDPVQMRFTTVDPIRSGPNWYSYVNNDPVNNIDPDGLREVLADDIRGNPITLPVQNQEAYLKAKTNIVIQRDSANDFYEDTLSINIGNQTLQQLGVQSEADSAGSEDQTLPAGDYKGELWEASGHYKNAILIQEPDFFIHPDQWTTEKYIDDPKNGPWSKPLSEGCQICKLADFDILTATLKGFGFEYGTGDTIDVEIIDKKNK